ncbi:hypothetical protein C8R47DRAFT_1215442 [Mycena vitilis]|nr:hypothetical protein C8R47DRAFT_1215442 [Mycena vitilis]
MAKRPQPGEFGRMFEDAPLLRKVELFCFGSQKHALPWSQLTSLQLTRSSLDQLAEILTWTPNLVSLTVSRIYPPSSAPRISHYELRSLMSNISFEQQTYIL